MTALLLVRNLLQVPNWLLLAVPPGLILKADSLVTLSIPKGAHFCFYSSLSLVNVISTWGFIIFTFAWKRPVIHSPPRKSRSVDFCACASLDPVILHCKSKLKLLLVSEVIWSSRCTGGLLCCLLKLCWACHGEGWDGGTDSDGGIGTDPSSRSERRMVFCQLSINPTHFSCGNAHTCIANLDLHVLGFFKLLFTNTPEIIQRCLLITVWKLLFSSHPKVEFLGKSLANFVCFCFFKSDTWYNTLTYLRLICSSNWEGITLPDCIEICLWILC